MSSKLSNVIGAPFDDYVLQQLYIRAAKNSTVSRTNDEVLFLANKTSWVRLVSSVNIVNSTETNNSVSFYNKLGLNTNDYPSPEALAKNWILEAGTSTQNGNGINIRSGIGPDGAYGLGGTEELGYRPMPGLTSVTVETTGRLGSLRQATITFKVWNMNQLNVVEALYFRLGFSMLLEWGHSQYFKNPALQGNSDSTFVTSGIYGIGDPFTPDYRKEGIQHAISRKQRESSGNYDGMLGIVSHFEWSFNQEGGYDCTVRLIGQGAIMDSMRINQNYKLPEGLAKQFKKNQNELKAYQELVLKLAEQIKNQQNQPAAAVNPPKHVPANITELQDYAVKLDNYPPVTLDLFTKAHAFYPAASVSSENTSTIPDYYYTSTSANSTDKETYNKEYFGLFLQGNGGYWKRLPANYYFTFNKNFINQTVKDVIDSKALKNPALTDVYYNVPTKVQGYSWIGKYLYKESSDTSITVFQGSQSGPVQTTKVIPVGLNDAYNSDTFYIEYSHLVGPAIGNKSKKFYIDVSFTNSDSNYSVSREQLLTAFENWFTSTPATVKLEDVVPTGVGLTSSLGIKATADIEVPDATYIGTSNVIKEKVPTKAIKVRFTFAFNNTMLIQDIGNSAETALANSQPTSQANTGDQNNLLNQATPPQTDAPEGYSSALEAMLVVVQTESQRYAINKNEVVPVPIKATTEQFYNNGILKGVLSSSVAPISETDFNLQQYALRGFNSNLMSDPTIYKSIPQVDFDTLCTSYVVKYTQSDLESIPDSVHFPVYIQLGYLLAFLNNMCLIYDSTQVTTTTNSTTGESKRPYIYIDFNPETNFCLTAPQQLSVDPTVCLIPFNATESDYLSIYPSDIAKNLKDSFKPQEQNILTKVLNDSKLEFKNPQNAYQGKLMNILLNVDYLLKVTREHAGSDPEHAVNLQKFLETILIDVNKSLGNVNSFRVAYRDESYTVQLVDDQWTPAMKNNNQEEKTILIRNQYLDNSPTFYSGVKAHYGQLPIFGQQSLARQFQLKTNIATKMSSMIAISAQAQTGSINSKDHSEFSYLNQNFRDRYKPWIQDASNGSTGNSTGTKDKESNDQKLASLFDTHVKSIYSNWYLSPDKINMAKNYYIERMSKVKSNNPVTTAAPFIPANLDITVDGISGIIMGNAFTIPEDRLPNSLKSFDGFTKVGFIVVGLTHTINQNQWLTKIRGQMIKLREQLKTPTGTVVPGDEVTATVTSTQTTAAAPVNASGELGLCKYGVGCQRNFGQAYKKTTLYQDAAFRAGVDAITRKYNIADPEALYKVMYAESGLKASDTLFHGNKPFAVGLIQFTPDNVQSGLIPSLDAIIRTNGVDQLKYVDKYLSPYASILNRGDIVAVYAAVFFPLAGRHLNEPDWVIQSKGLSAYIVSYQNPAIACAAGKKPGEPLTIADFRKYVNCIT